MNDAASPRGPAAEGYDLMRVRGLRALILWRGFPQVLQAALLIAFVTLAVLSWNVYPPAGVNGKLFAKSNLSTLLIWGIWWPVMIWTAVLAGRAWCMVCPLELVSHFTERLAVRFLRPPAAMPGWIASGAIIVSLYVVIQMLVAGIQLHRVPAYTSYFLIGLLGLAAVTGLRWRNRAFCRGFCPVGLLLGTYGRGGMLAVRPAGKTAAENASVGPDARMCPGRINPAKLDRNTHCLVCCHCVKASAPGAMRLVLRRPFSAADARDAVASWPVTVFVMLVSGFVIGELFSEWPAARRFYLGPPERLAHWIGWRDGAGWIEGAWTLGAVPVVVWLALAGVLRLAGAREGTTLLWRRLALPIAVIVSVGHMCKGLAKFVSWAPFLPGAWRDPDGLATARLLTEKKIPLPAPWLGLPAVSWIALALMAAGLVLAIREFRLANPADPQAGRGAWPLTILAAAFAAIIAGWR